MRDMVCPADQPLSIALALDHLTAMPDQLQLPLLPPPCAARHVTAEFIRTAANDAALTWLDRVADWPQGRLALWGEVGCGKTHLLHRWTSTMGTQHLGAHYLTGPTLPRLDELPDLSTLAGLAIDDADAMTDEATLLHLLNATAEARLPVLLAARAPPARWPLRVPDLASRLRAMTAVEILPPDDDLLRIMLKHLFKDRQHRVACETQDWLLTRLPRTQAALWQAVDRLDRAALGSSGGITRPLARAELADLIDADCDATDPDGDTRIPEMPIPEMPVDAMPVDEMPVDEMPVDEMTVSSALPSPPTLRLL
jgi:chromosomal replication initiation ATPase DnaA